MTETTSEPSKRRWVTLLRPKVAIPLGLLVLLLLSPVLYRGWNLGHVPDLGDPFPAELLEKPELSDEENAWVNYQRAETLRSIPVEKIEKDHYIVDASSLLNRASYVADKISVWYPYEFSKQMPVRQEKDRRYLERALLSNQTALLEWKQGTDRTHFRDLDQVRDDAIQKSHVSSSGQFQLYELGIARAGQLASQGKQLEALDWILAVYRYSRHLTQSGGTKNWERAVEIAFEVFRALDLLLDDDVYSHDNLLDFLHRFEQAHKLTGEFSQALADDYLRFKQQILNAHTLTSAYQTELETGSISSRENRFETYIRGEPQLSLRVLQHHYEYIKNYLQKPVEDRCGKDPYFFTTFTEEQFWFEELHRQKLNKNSAIMPYEQLNATIKRAVFFTEAMREASSIILFDTHLGDFYREDDQMLYESLRILIAAHAFATLDPQNSALIEQSAQLQLMPLPLTTMEELVNDYFKETPRDPYDTASVLILAVCPTGESFILTSRSSHYEEMLSGASSELLLNRFYSLVNRIPTIEPRFDELQFHLPTVTSRRSIPPRHPHQPDVPWVSESDER